MEPILGCLAFLLPNSLFRSYSFVRGGAYLFLQALLVGLLHEHRFYYYYFIRRNQAKSGRKRKGRRAERVGMCLVGR